MRKEAIVTLESIGVKLDKDYLMFSPHKSKEIKAIPLESIAEIQLTNAQISLGKTLLFWFQRILFWNKYTATSILDDDTEYRNLYDFRVKLNDNTSLIKRVKDLDLIGVQKAIDELRKCHLT